MPRVKRGSPAHRRHKRVLRQAKGYQGTRHRLIKTAREAVEKGWKYSYRDRKQRKRQFRSLWIARINAAAREHGLSYSQFIHGLTLADLREAAADDWPEMVSDRAVLEAFGPCAGHPTTP